MNCKTGGLIMFLFFIIADVSAQIPSVITLTSAIDMSIANSKALKIKTAQIESSTAAITEAKQRRLPNTSVSGSYLQLSSANIDLKIKSNNTTPGQTNEIPKVSKAMYGTFNVSVPLYTGGKINFGIISSQLLEKAAKLDLEVQKEEVISTTIESYANLYKASQAVAIVKENLLQSKQREKEFSDLEKNGLLARNDLLKAQLQSSTIELSLLDAENNLQLANLNMNLLLGLSNENKINLDSASLSAMYNVLTAQDYIQQALSTRNDVKANNLRKNASDINVKSIKAEKLPNLSLTGGYIAAYVPKILTITNAINVGVGFSYNIASLWKTKAKVEQAESQTKQLTLANSILQDHITLEVSKNYFDLIKSQKKIELLKNAIEQSTENYRIVKNKYDNSLSTLSDLLEADVSNLQTKLNYLFAKADAFVAYNRLLQSAGLLSKEFKK